MTDTQGPSKLDIRPPSRSPWRNLSVVWLVPLLALIVSLAVAWRSFSDRGELIQISFENAAGVTAGETTLHYRDVVIGVVERIGFSDDLDQVLVWVRVQNKIAPYLDDTAQFWVVRPEVSAEGVSGLSTVLSGVYIEGTWEKERGTPQTEFQGLESRPLVDVNEKGTRVTLRASDGNIMSAGTPVFYRGVRVGRTEAPQIDEGGALVKVEAFIEAPHDKLLTTATRFWDTSGFSVSFGPGGLKLDVGSFAALVTGGVAFNTFFTGGDPVKPGYAYDLYEDETNARENAFSRASGKTVMVSTLFDGGVSGLASGAAVQFEGLRVGEVSTISAFVTGQDEGMQVRQQVTMEIEAQLLGLPTNSTDEDVYDFLAVAINGGLRARLNSANLLSASLIVEMVDIDDAAPAELDRTAEPYPLVPSVKSNLTDINATLEGMMKRVNGLKIEDLIAQAITTMASIEAIAEDKNTRAAPEALVGLLNDTRTLVSNDEIAALPGELKLTVAELRAIIARVNEQGVVERLAAVLEAAAAATENISTAAEGAPALIADLRAVAAKARDLKAEDLVASATSLLQSADKLIDNDATRALPASLSSALDEVRTLVSDLREGGAVANVNATLSSAREASQSLQEAMSGLPELSKRLEALVARSETLIGAYGARSDFNEETLAMLREVRTAARTINALARALERSPNSILFGK